MSTFNRGRFKFNTTANLQDQDHSESDHNEEQSKTKQMQHHAKKPSYADSERYRREDTRYSKYTEVAESDKSIEIDSRHDTMFHSVYPKPKLGSSLLISASPLKFQEKWTMTADEPPVREQKSSHTVIDLCLAFQETLGSKFTEMLRVHKEIMLELMSKERSRDDQIRRLTQDLSELMAHNVRLQIENRSLHDMLDKQKE
mmetsp:Transcript_29357/g.52554  ORF Transcript_29357/g.52554 Transcript_29357/m.52554 type:complete len:200 (+) Transcript_29357:28-627(+)